MRRIVSVARRPNVVLHRIRWCLRAGKGDASQDRAKCDEGSINVRQEIAPGMFFSRIDDRAIDA
jgi:hypothetical protein